MDPFNFVKHNNKSFRYGEHVYIIKHKNTTTI